MRARTPHAHGRAALVAVAVALVGAACAEPGVEAVDLVHVHDLIVDEGEPTYVAAHTGLFEVRDGRTVRVDDAFDDLMAATRSSSGELMASGHPQLDDDRLQVPGRPPLLGLVVREDGLWQPRSLLGEADFHAIATQEDLVLAADGTSGAVLASTDAGRTWEPRGRAELLAIALAPEDPDHVAGVTYDGTVVVSTDGAETWEQVQGIDGALDVAWGPGGPVVVTGDEAVWAIEDDGPARRGELPGVAAITSDGGTLVALVTPADLRTSTDGGATWRPLD